MSDHSRLRYQRLLRWYPRRWRHANEDVVLATLLDVDDARGGLGPSFAEAWSLRLDGLAHRMRPLRSTLSTRGSERGGDRVQPTYWVRLPTVIGATAIATVAVAGWAVAQSPSAVPAAAVARSAPALITTWAEANQAVERAVEDIAACLNRAGVDAHVTREPYNPGASIDLPGMNADDQATLSACAESAPNTAPPLHDPAFRADAYRWIHGQYECLIDAGFAMPMAPSFDDFETEIGQLGAVGWNPISDATEATGAEHAGQGAALLACPADTVTW